MVVDPVETWSVQVQVGLGHECRRRGSSTSTAAHARRHLRIDGGYTSLVHLDRAAREHGISLPGRCRATSPASTARTSASTATTPTSDLVPEAGQRGLARPYPTSSPTAAPLIVARYTRSQCQPCPDRPRCTSSSDARNVGFPPQELRDLQVRVRAGQQAPEWRACYAVRSGVEGTINEFAHGHGMRRCCYRGQLKAHLQHVLTAIAVNIERRSNRPETEDISPSGPPPHSRPSWTSRGYPNRSPGAPSAPDPDQDHRQSQAEGAMGCREASREGPTQMASAATTMALGRDVGEDVHTSQAGGGC